MEDVHQEVKHDMCQHKALRTWLRDEEANASAASVADRSLAEPPVRCGAVETVAAACAGVGTIDDERRGEGPTDRL